MNIRPILSVISTVTDILDTVLTGSNSNTVQRKRYTLQGVSGNICFSSVGNRIIVSNLSDKPISLSFPRQNEVDGSRLILKPVALSRKKAILY